MLVPKGFLRLERVGRNTQDRGLTLRKRASQSCEVDGLLGAARGVRARVEKQHEFSSRIVGERDGFAAIARKAEGGRLGALGQLEFTSGGRVSFSAGRFCRGRIFRPRPARLIRREGEILTFWTGPYAMLAPQRFRVACWRSWQTFSPWSYGFW